MPKHPQTLDNQRRHTEAKRLLAQLKASGVLDQFGNDHVAVAIDALNALDSRSTNRDYTNAFYFAIKHLSYAFHLRTER